MNEEATRRRAVTMAAQTVLKITEATGSNRDGCLGRKKAAHIYHSGKITLK